MWSNVISPTSPPGGCPFTDADSAESPTSTPPPTRSKHATALHYSRSDACYYIYVYGGNSNRFALKDFWELNVQTGEWREIAKPTDSPTGTETWPPRLQEHTLVSANNRLYMFGGELCANSDTNSHVWVWQREHENRGWEKIKFKHDCGSGGSGGGGGGGKKLNNCAPQMRRGHSAVVCDVDGSSCMVVYGGYRDLKGSLGDCWAYAVATNTWTLLTTPSPSSQNGHSKSQPHSFWTNILSYWTSSSSSTSSSSTSYTNLSQTNGYYKCKHQDQDASVGPQPPSRHSHSAVHYNGKMWIYGGMCDLVELSDFWVLDLESRKWAQVKCMYNPGVLKGHAAVVVGPYMYVFGGETKGGVRVDDVWRFEFAGETFERLTFPGCHPCPRVFATATKLPTRRKRDANQLATQLHLPQQQEMEDHHQQQSQCDDIKDTRPPSPKSTRPSNFRKSTSVVRFADTQHLVTYSDDYNCSSSSASPTTAHTPSCSDYSSMETINYVENPNYRKYSGSGESFEMKPIGWRENRVPRQHAEYVLMIGGLESHRSAVFSKRDLVVWRLRVDCFCTGGDENSYSVASDEIQLEHQIMMQQQQQQQRGGVNSFDDRFLGNEIERGDRNFEVEF